MLKETMFYEVRYRDCEKKQPVKSMLVYCDSFAQAESQCPSAAEVVAIVQRRKIKEVENGYELKEGNAFFIVNVVAQTINDQGKPKKIRYQVVTQAPSTEPSKAAKNVEDLMEQGYDMVVESVAPAKFDEIDVLLA